MGTPGSRFGTRSLFIPQADASHFFLLSLRPINSGSPPALTSTISGPRRSCGCMYKRLFRSKPVDSQKFPALTSDRLAPLFSGAPNMGGRAMSGPKSFHMLAAEGKIKTIAGVTPQSISADGNGLVLSDGQTLPADVIIFATGFGPSWSFVREPFDLSL